MKKKQERKEEKGETAWESYQRKRKEKRKEKKLQAKINKDALKEKGFGKPTEEESAVDRKKRAELDLLVSEKHNNGMLKEDFKGNTGDKRFQAVLKDKDYAIDPTHKNFRKVAEGEFIKEQKIKRQKLH